MARVLDASALLAYFLDESGQQVVAAALSQSDVLIASVNIAEVATKMLRDGGEPVSVRNALGQGVWRIVTVDADLALRAAELYALTRSAGLSLGDRICLALAEREACPALTADRSWAMLNLGIAVELIR